MALSTICQSWGVSLGQVLCRSGIAGRGHVKAWGVAAAAGVGAGVGVGAGLLPAGLLSAVPHPTRTIPPSTTAAAAGRIFTKGPPGWNPGGILGGAGP